MARLDDGYQTLISFAADTTVKFWEKTVTPPGVDGGGEIDTTVMANTAYRTRCPKSLITMSNASLTVAYDPATYDEILALVNINTLITITFPDGSKLAFYGWLNSFTPGECQEGEQPTAEIEIIASNHTGGVETGPLYTAPTP
jgi:hypothetical protein